MRVLVAEDHIATKGWLLRALKLLGHEVDAVISAEELLARVLEFAPDAVLSDIGLPGADGIACGLRLRKDYPRMTIVLMTGDPVRADAARKAGFSRVLSKPFALAELSAALGSI